MSLAKACQDLYTEWVDADEKMVMSFDATVFNGLKPLQRIELLSQLWQVVS
jgi:hypothetical protein